MQSPKLTLAALALALLSLTACVTDRTFEPIAIDPVKPCGSISLPPRLSDANRAQLANELQAAPVDAVWPDVLVNSARVERDVRACQSVKP